MLRPELIVSDCSHRPWPAPARPWALFMRWHELLFLHYPVPPAALRPLIPPSLELDTFDGSAWLGIVPFRMTGIRPRLGPCLPWLSAFPELNVRTYVTAHGKPGVWFFSLDASNPLAVRAARRCFSLPYFDARIRCRREGDVIHYHSVRTHRGAPPARFAARYRPTGPARGAAPGTLEYFLTERYCLYAAPARNGCCGPQTYRGDVAHAPWPLQPAEVELEEVAMTGQLGL